jgi:aminoglycoside phosphotransferase (APT) family kinase protein
MEAENDLAEQLRVVVSAALGVPVVVDAVTRMPGGASRETWSFSVRGPDDEGTRLVLRRDPSGAPVSGLRLEADLVRAAAGAGVPVPHVVVAGDVSHGLGAAFMITEFVEGETIPRRILRDEGLAAVRPVLAEQCGVALAAVHRIPPSEVPGLVGGDALDGLRRMLDHLGQPHPAFELGMRWLEESRPAPSALSVVHGDFRHGNLIVGSDGIRAVLDWELAHLGDPVEDLGWLCLKAWRFGAPLEVGGFGTVEQLLDAYEGAGGGVVDRGALHWWQVLGTLRWGTICIVRRVCEVEWDLLELVP